MTKDTNKAPVTVTQADRDAAADLHHWYNGEFTDAEMLMRTGRYGDDARVQAFARHRLNTDARMREALEAIVKQTGVGSPGTTPMRSKWARYPAALYHEARAALGETQP